MEPFKCPHCNKVIIEKNLKDETKPNDIIIKSRLVFLNEDGNVLCRCPDCKKIVGLPLNFIKSSSTILP